MIDRLKLTKKQQALVQRFIRILDQMKENNIGIVEVSSLVNDHDELYTTLHFLNLRHSLDFNLDLGELDESDCYMNTYVTEPDRDYIIKDLDRLKELAKSSQEDDEPITYCLDACELDTFAMDTTFWKSHYYEDDPIVMVEYGNTASTRNLVKANLYRKEVRERLDDSYVYIHGLKSEKELLCESIENLKAEIALYQTDETKQDLLEYAKSDLQKNERLVAELEEKITKEIEMYNCELDEIRRRYAY